MLILQEQIYFRQKFIWI